MAIPPVKAEMNQGGLSELSPQPGVGVGVGGGLYYFSQLGCKS